MVAFKPWVMIHEARFDNFTWCSIARVPEEVVATETEKLRAFIRMDTEKEEGAVSTKRL